VFGAANTRKRQSPQNNAKRIGFEILPRQSHGGDKQKWRSGVFCDDAFCCSSKAD
jgi:hypothetical protein